MQNHMVGAMGGKLALLYLIIIGIITLSHTADVGVGDALAIVEQLDV